MAVTNRPRVFLDINIGEEPAGRLTIELFAEETPKTCENFRQLCTGEHKGLSYTKAPFHRVIDEFMIQGGDIENGDGTGTSSIYGGEFEDENLIWRDMDAAGLVCSANRGKDTNGSQFFVTLEPCEHLNGKHTIFGRLVSGEDVLRKIADVKVDNDDRPIQPVLVSRCGELERTKKARPVAAAESKASSTSRDRGRRRRSGDSDVEMSNSPPVRPVQRTRRQSDNLVDEGLRGRPRQRSGDRSPSQAIEESDEQEDNGPDSPVQKHKRKRSSSPSRANGAPASRTDESTESYVPRRRRSLPNQYAEERVRRENGDGDRYRPSPRRDDNRFAGRQNDGPGNYRRRDNDRYRPRDRYGDDGRLSGDGRLGGSGSNENEPPVKYKGRGSMKYREPDRW